jgi:A/G-specific adenine glycosylase
MGKLTDKNTPAGSPHFIQEIWNYYETHGRDLPWRVRGLKTKRSSATSSYAIVVSEIMLQQTQVARVISKFESWMKRFPDFETLASASTADVLREWQGLGYNRRGLNLQRLAQTVMKEHGGQLPRTYEELVELPGIGPNTAGSLLAFAFDIPRPFIETNIRSVFIHFFFPDVEAAERAEGRSPCKTIRDAELMPHIEAALADPRNQANPREWYYALMDYGVKLKRELSNPSRRSAHHVKQTKFEGSNRALRSSLLRSILEQPQTEIDLVKKFATETRVGHFTEDKVVKNIEDLMKEGFIEENRGKIRAKK